MLGYALSTRIWGSPLCPSPPVRTLLERCRNHPSPLFLLPDTARPYCSGPSYSCLLPRVPESAFERSTRGTVHMVSNKTSLGGGQSHVWTPAKPDITITPLILQMNVCSPLFLHLTLFVGLQVYRARIYCKSFPGRVDGAREDHVSLALSSRWVSAYWDGSKGTFVTVASCDTYG